jgi:hypothetical protein
MATVLLTTPQLRPAAAAAAAAASLQLDSGPTGHRWLFKGRQQMARLAAGLLLLLPATVAAAAALRRLGLKGVW